MNLAVVFQATEMEIINARRVSDGGKGWATPRLQKLDSKYSAIDRHIQA